MTRISMTLSTLALLAASACGGNPEEAVKFTGTWLYASGTATASCGGPSQTEPLNGTVSITEGADADLLIVEGSQCPIKLDVMEGVATARPGQSCEATEQGTNVRRSIASMTLTLAGSSLTMNESSNLTIVAGGRAVACSFTRTGSLSKLSK